ncbi:DNA polymerase I-like protein [Salicola phage SCTP-2]|nr:DNA polymerase I-like protein [Salicola phage SCTP-2]
MSKKTYLHVDFNNMFHRMKHMSVKGSSVDEQIGLVIHQMLTGIKSAWDRFDASHVIVELEGKSWRKQVSPDYKMNRVAQRLKRKPSEIEMDEEFQKVANDFQNYLKRYTNCTVVSSKNAEADDVIATFIFDHPDKNHIIVSSDKDFHQLISSNVCIFDAMKGEIVTHQGVFDDRMKPVIDKNTKKQKQIGDPEWILFKKCFRGDPSDNIFSAYPRVREKGTKNTVGLQEAFNDRHSKGYEWNTVMMHEWTDADGNKRLVKDEYEFNKILIDLRLIPDFVKEQIREDLTKEMIREVKTNEIGFHFLKFCKKYDLQAIIRSSSYYLDFLGKKAPEDDVEKEKELAQQTTLVENNDDA